ncbi:MULTISPECIES: hypothetical protein [unclassified Pseudomonas]|uniref:hypothetical protein n=1 Tax=unclassified Pseudomonas TaxID=196821 RepID=UPI000A1E0E2F|nr:MULTISPECIES: hypothetical protein [unclassified Pseudomonas]
MKIYENIIIGNFLFGLGWALNAKNPSGSIGCAINMLQQTPADKLLGDLMVGFKGVVRLIEFKREGADMTKELAKHSLLSKAVASADLARISREVHWYLEAGATEESLNSRIVPYLEAFDSDDYTQSMSSFIQELADEVVNPKNLYTNEQVAEYLHWLRMTQGSGRIGSGGLLLVADQNGTLRYLPMRDLMDLSLTHELWLSQEHEHSRQQLAHELQMDMKMKQSKGMTYGR